MNKYEGLETREIDNLPRLKKFNLKSNLTSNIYKNLFSLKFETGFYTLVHIR